MLKDSKEYTIFDAVTPVAVTSSTDATPIVVTATAHGLSTGDLVIINGHTTNIAANGIHRITKVTNNAYSLQNYETGANVAGTGGGAGASGVMAVAPKVLFVQDFKDVQLNLITSGSANFTAKVAVSDGKVLSDVTPPASDTPNFGATQSKTNPYNYAQIINLEDASAVDGDTGMTSAGTDLNISYEVNTNGKKYITVIPTAWSAGLITIKAKLFNNS
jgi:hypothetical protein